MIMSTGCDMKVNGKSLHPESSDSPRVSKCYLTSPQSVMTIFLITPPSCKPNDSILVTTSMPSFTCPNTTCLPSSLSEKKGEKVTLVTGEWFNFERTCGTAEITKYKCSEKVFYHSVLVVLMKNWEPLVFGPEFAIESVPAEIEKPTSKSIKCDAVKQDHDLLLPPSQRTFRPLAKEKHNTNQQLREVKACLSFFLKLTQIVIMQHFETNHPIMSMWMKFIQDQLFWLLHVDSQQK